MFCLLNIAEQYHFVIVIVIVIQYFRVMLGKKINIKLLKRNSTTRSE